MIGFLIIGAVGLVLLLASLVLGEVLDGMFESLELDFAGGFLSGPVIGAFLAAFGFGAALIMYAADVGAGPGALGGLASGIAVGGLAGVVTRSLMTMPTDDAVRTSDLVGKTATVVTRIPETGVGEVTLVHQGQFMKLAARASNPISSGQSVTVTAVTSPSSVVVELTDAGFEYGKGEPWTNSE